ncbi:MAG: Gfo/Idh/MocA family oxidoreductase [Synoicihabitans sp.]
MSSFPPPSLDRRRFLQTLGAAGLAAPLWSKAVVKTAAGPRLRHASFGAGGMAGADINMIMGSGKVDLVAVADVDLQRGVPELLELYPDLRVYQDWRELLQREHENLDSVNVSTPDHMHGPIAMAAMQLGLHVYCQKPLAHDIHDVRQLTDYAREHGLVTQMGIQIHSESPYLEAVSLVQRGAIGKVKEVHLWSDKKWGDAGAPPEGEFVVPPDFDWDGWLGVCEDRPFIGDQYFHPGNWRKRLDFGTGTFGDMGCHIFDPVFKALELSAPTSVRSEGPAPDQWNWANNARIRYEFPSTPHTVEGGIAFFWYDGDERPPADVMALVTEENPPKNERPPPPIPAQGSVVIGTEGTMLLPHFKPATLFPRAQYKNYDRPRIKSGHHWIQWVDACLGEDQTSTPFEYSGPLTEAVLLGSVAVRFPHQTLNWDAAKLQFSNVKAANAYLKREARAGWEVKGL